MVHFNELSFRTDSLLCKQARKQSGWLPYALFSFFFSSMHIAVVGANTTMLSLNDAYRTCLKKWIHCILPSRDARFFPSYSSVCSCFFLHSFSFSENSHLNNFFLLLSVVLQKCIKKVSATDFMVKMFYTCSFLPFSIIAIITTMLNNERITIILHGQSVYEFMSEV